ncbi:gliding motility lipoprotein GldH [Sphingobacterium shayense]|uniref:gliding motility lipoprotein GldH n=1 Tax=Sphingobacterium shayense TaxID=626343 RepID=UPI00155295EA|nr:gliding motility lipoprotein GldH [Sphingobacterium shayense]NQD70509.1 gliding motility lipoprotein GldH [Sphingobacterium shayense]
MKGLFWCLLTVLFFTRCTNDVFYQVNKPIENRAWTYAQVPTFNIEIKDNSKPFDLWVNIRHTGEYDYANLFILVHQEGPRNQDTTYRHELTLARQDGRWLGHNAGNLYENQLLLKENYTFPDTGVYTVGIEQNMRENPLREITDVGVQLIQK